MKKIVIFLGLVMALTTAGRAQLSLDTAGYIKNNAGIYALLIEQHNKIIKNSYYNDSTANSLFNDQSLTKSICSILIGIAIDKHFIASVDEKLVDFFPALKNDTDKRKQQITIRQVMNQASGLYHEDLRRLDIFLTSSNPSDVVLSAPMAAGPGKEWHYNNAASHLLSVILTKATHMDTRTFANAYLFSKTGITHFDWTKMKDGYYDGSGLLSIHLRTQDMLTIGLLILNGGSYNHQQIVSSTWINLIMQPDVFYPADWGFEKSTYALCWYHALFRGIPITYGMGWGGQFLVLIPSRETVVVINESIANATAIAQSNIFINHLFPLIFDQLQP